MKQKQGLSFFLLVLVLGATLICSPVTSPEQARHHAEHLQGAADHADHLGTCEDDQPVLTTALQRIKLLGRSDEASSASRVIFQAQEIGGEGLEMAEDLPAFLTGSLSQDKASAKLYKLHLSYLI
ncbi:MAG: hypothetical protein HY347_04580 [candidate division NC10 bacterium]|nr:hypothetical protein [candidate division NC10 bacterium]